MAVFDANILVALIVDLPWSDRARRSVTDHPLRIAPSLVAAEVGSAVWQNVRSGGLSPDQARTGCKRAISIVALEPIENLVETALQFAIDHDHSVYDCLYLALVEREDTLLVTADRKVANLADRLGMQAEMLR
ncbi:MAG: type II toxin-antitoxin system VapC family toxin [Hyphomicrobiales bacterium]|nr:type II toxin-antitoxin system VapC family toxin [Hyphomicrobiales bacterium]